MAPTPAPSRGFESKEPGPPDAEGFRWSPTEGERITSSGTKTLRQYLRRCRYSIRNKATSDSECSGDSGGNVLGAGILARETAAAVAAIGSKVHHISKERNKLTC